MNETWDYSKRKGLTIQKYLRLTTLLHGVTDREKLWNEVEKSEKKKTHNSQGKYVGCPTNRTHQRTEKKSYQRFAQRQFWQKRHDCRHLYSRNKARIHHAHIMLTMRHVTPEGFGKPTGTKRKPSNGEKAGQGMQTTILRWQAMK